MHNRSPELQPEHLRKPEILGAVATKDGLKRPLFPMKPGRTTMPLEGVRSFKESGRISVPCFWLSKCRLAPTPSGYTWVCANMVPPKAVVFLVASFKPTLKNKFCNKHDSCRDFARSVAVEWRISLIPFCDNGPMRVCL